MRLYFFKNSSIKTKIIFINIILILSMIILFTYNNLYIKKQLNKDVTTYNKKYMNYMYNNIDNELRRIKKTVYSYSSSKPINNVYQNNNKSIFMYNNLLSIKEDLRYLKNSLPYVSDMYIYFTNINATIGSLGKYDKDVLENIFKQNNKDFKLLDLNINTEKLLVYENMIMFIYPVNNLYYVIVNIDKNKMIESLGDFSTLFNTIFCIYTDSGQLFVSNQNHTIKYDTLNNDSNILYIDGENYNKLHIHSDNHNLDFFCLSSNKTLNSRLNSINKYTLIMLSIFFLINVVILLLNIIIYNPIKKLASTYGINQNRIRNEVDIISQSFDELKNKNMSVQSKITNLEKVYNHNILLKLISNRTDNIVKKDLIKLRNQFKNYIILSIVNENVYGNKEISFINQFEEKLTHYCNYKKILYDTTIDIFIISIDHIENIESLIISIFDNLLIPNLYLIGGISKRFNEITKINQAYKQSIQAINNCKINLNPFYKIITYNNEINTISHSYNLSILEEQELIQYTLKGNIKSLKKFFNKLEDNITKFDLNDFKILYTHLYNLLLIVINSKTKIQELSLDKINIQNHYNPMYIHSSIKSKYLEICNNNQNQNFNLYNKIIHYISKNYMNDISLNDIAEELGITSVYLSTYFKKQSGITLSKYINKIRIETAISILENNNKIKIQDLCFKVGIPNVNTFIRNFKKITGTTPYKYKSLL